MISSPAVFTEVIHLYLARDLRPAPLQHEAQEVLEIHWFPLGQALAWCDSGEIRDAKTLAGLYRARAHLAG